MSIDSKIAVRWYKLFIILIFSFSFVLRMTDYSYAQRTFVAHDFESGRKLWLALQYDLRDAFAADRARNYVEALRLYRQVASQPDISVAFPGVVPNDDPRGGTISTIAWEYNSTISTAMIKLSEHYEKGMGVPPDPVQADFWRQKANKADVDVVAGKVPPWRAVTTTPVLPPQKAEITPAPIPAASPGDTTEAEGTRLRCDMIRGHRGCPAVVMLILDSKRRRIYTDPILGYAQGDDKWVVDGKHKIWAGRSFLKQ